MPEAQDWPSEAAGDERHRQLRSRGGGGGAAIERVKPCQPDQKLVGWLATKMPKPNKKLGLGAVVTARATVLHPTDPIKAKYINTYSSQRLADLSVTGRSVRSIKNTNTDVLLLSHVDFPGRELWARPGAIKLQRAGPPPFYVWASEEAAPAGKGMGVVCLAVNTFRAVFVFLLWGAQTSFNPSPPHIFCWFW